MHRGVTWRMVVCLAAMLACASPARADYEAGRVAWQAGQHAEALAEWRAAARAGDGKAMLALGRAFAKGLGVPQDYILAHMWLNLAAGGGSAEAARERDTLAANMIPAHIALAQERARAWLSGRRADAPKAVSTPRAAAPSAPAGPPPPPRAIREAQGLLAALGYKPGPADGRWGPGTAKAYAAFLRDAGMPPVNVLTPDALRAMRGIAAGRKASSALAKGDTGASKRSKAERATRDLSSALSASTLTANCDGWNTRIFFSETTPEKVKMCLKGGADPNARDGYGNTPLHRAAGYNKAPAVVAALIEVGANPNAKNESFFTPLHLAARYNENPAVTAALLKSGAEANVQDRAGKTPEDRARDNRNPAVLATLKASAAASGPAGPPPLRAIREAQALMTALGYKPGPADGRWGPRTGRAYSAFLRDRGMPPGNILTPDALRAMRAAAKRGSVAARTTGPRTAQRKSARPPANLHRLAAAGDIDRLKAALASGADANARDGKGWTPLMHAVDKGYALLVPLLLKADADPDIQAPDGATALFVAVAQGQTDIIGMLREAHADPTIKGPKSKTAIDLARLRYGSYFKAKRNGEAQAILDLLKKWGIPMEDTVPLINRVFRNCGMIKWRDAHKDQSHFDNIAQRVDNNTIKFIINFYNENRQASYNKYGRPWRWEATVNLRALHKVKVSGKSLQLNFGSILMPAKTTGSEGTKSMSITDYFITACDENSARELAQILSEFATVDN